MNMHNKNCGCTNGQGVVPGPCISRNCGKAPQGCRIKTEVLPASVGTDAPGQPYAPKLGAYQDTIVTYSANDAIIFYDSRGVWTKIVDDKLKLALEQEIVNRKAADEALSEELTEQIKAEVEARTQNINWLQENINTEVNARKSDVENLQTNINQEANTRESQYRELHQGLIDENSRAYNAEQALSSRIDEVINSPDVRFIVQTYADLEAIDKNTVGDKDYARVLTDETHDGQATYYQFSKAENSWTFVGTAGAYYTESEIDSKFDMVNHDIQNLVELTDGLPNTIVSDVTGKTTDTSTILTISKNTINSNESTTSEIVIPTSGSGGDDPRLTDKGAERANRLPDYVMSGFNPATSVDDGVQLSMNGYNLSSEGTVRSTTIVPLASTTSNGVISSSDKTKLNRIPQTVVSASGIRQTSDDQKTSILVKYKNTATGQAYDDAVEIPTVSAQYNGLISVQDKAKLDDLRPMTVDEFKQYWSSSK